jgi:hypothetical protein
MNLEKSVVILLALDRQENTFFMDNFFSIKKYISMRVTLHFDINKLLVSETELSQWRLHHLLLGFEDSSFITSCCPFPTQ